MDANSRPETSGGGAELVIGDRIIFVSEAVAEQLLRMYDLGTRGESATPIALDQATSS